MKHALATVLAAALLACGRDPAEREYFAALEGEKTGADAAALIPHLDRAISLAPERAVYWEKRADYRTSQLEYGSAKADLDHAIALADRPWLRFRRGLVLCRSGACTEALADLDAAIAAQPENAQFYRGRALVRVRAGLAEQALEDAERLVKRAPQAADSYHVRGTALARLGRHRAAIADFDEAARRRPELSYPVAARAESYESLGDAVHGAADRRAAQLLARAHAACGDCNDPLP
jgi:tetratricopeptide (TPR) repeat protein